MRDLNFEKGYRKGGSCLRPLTTNASSMTLVYIETHEKCGADVLMYFLEIQQKLVGLVTRLVQRTKCM